MGIPPCRRQGIEMVDFLWVDGGGGGRVPAHMTGLSEEEREVT